MATANKLAGALSPYLLQHQSNPVHWYPWGDEALNLARELDRPILLSIGYSACHWCHVMAHESFEDEAIAERMNAGFVNIKVDREERPDLDRIYQLGHQLLTGRGGGWPLTVFLAPDDLTPFFAGTYFPARQRHGMIAFPELLARIEQAWRERRKELLEQNSRLREALEQVQRMAPGAAPPEASLVDRLLETLRGMFDTEYGGFGGGPKFPQAPFLEALAGPAVGAGNETARKMLRHTLETIGRSGLRDHLGGGFFRYCVDGRWEIPHFEKMLYDNAQLLPLYAEAAAAWEAPRLAEAADGLVAWLEREMLLPDGGFCASLDADSDEGEGAFYVWTPDEVGSVLGGTPVGGASGPDRSGPEDPPTADRAVAWFFGRYGLDGPPNFENRHWHLIIRKSVAALAGDQADTESVARALQTARDALLEAREQRARPGRDDKVIAGWNGLMIAGLCRAGRALDRPEWVRMAASALRFVCDNLFGPTPHAVWRDGKSDHPATLDDHAALLLACLEVLRERFEPRWLEQASALADAIIERFADADHGGLYLTAQGQEHLLTRPTANADDATPSGAGLAVIGLIRLGHLVAEPRYLDAAEKALSATGADMERHPAAHATLIRALAEWHRPMPQVLIGGEEKAAAAWQAALRTRFDCLVWAIPEGTEGLPAPLDRVAAPGAVRAVVCKGMVCLPEVENLDALKRQIDEHQSPPQT